LNQKTAIQLIIFRNEQKKSVHKI